MLPSFRRENWFKLLLKDTLCTKDSFWIFLWSWLKKQNFQEVPTRRKSWYKFALIYLPVTRPYWAPQLRHHQSFRSQWWRFSCLHILCKSCNHGNEFSPLWMCPNLSSMGSKFILYRDLPENNKTSKIKPMIIKQYCKQGKICPHFIFALFALLPVGEFKTGLTEL